SLLHRPRSGCVFAAWQTLLRSGAAFSLNVTNTSGLPVAIGGKIHFITSERENRASLRMPGFEWHQHPFFIAARFCAAQPGLVVCRLRPKASASSGTSSVMQLPAAI